MSVVNPSNRKDAAAGSSGFKPLAPWTYSSEELLTLEHEEVFRKNWQMACHVSDLPNPGSYVVLDFYRESVVVIRDKDGSIHAMKNHCRHRAARLLDEEKGECKSRIQCPYHGWSYALNGELKAIPRDGGFDGVNKSGFGLHKVEVELFHSFVFIRLNGAGGPTVAEMWGDFADNFAPYRFDEMVPLVPFRTAIWDANWKIAYDNYQESYHVPVGHPGFNRIMWEDLEELDGGGNGVGRGVFYMRNKRSTVPDEARYQDLLERCNTHLPEELRTKWDQYGMYPNLGLDIFAECVDFMQILPLGPRSTLVRYGVYGLPDEDAELAELRALNMKLMLEVDQEDIELCMRVQEGFDSPDYIPGPLSAEETGIEEFHNRLRQAIPVMHLDQAPAPGTLAQVNRQMSDS